MTSIKLATSLPPLSTQASSVPSHTVRAGDTISAVAEQHGCSVEELVKANPHVKDPDHIRPGQVLQLPVAAARPAGPAGTVGVTVQRGDTVSAIAQAHGCSVEDIVTLNPGLDPDHIRAGQVLGVPGPDLQGIADAIKRRLEAGLPSYFPPKHPSLFAGRPQAGLRSNSVLAAPALPEAAAPFSYDDV